LLNHRKHVPPNKAKREIYTVCFSVDNNPLGGVKASLFLCILNLWSS
jgi:hypothetical protein